MSFNETLSNDFREFSEHSARYMLQKNPWRTVLCHSPNLQEYQQQQPYQQLQQPQQLQQLQQPQQQQQPLLHSHSHPHPHSHSLSLSLSHSQVPSQLQSQLPSHSQMPSYPSTYLQSSYPSHPHWQSHSLPSYPQMQHFGGNCKSNYSRSGMNEANGEVEEAEEDNEDEEEDVNEEEEEEEDEDDDDDDDNEEEEEEAEEDEDEDEDEEAGDGNNHGNHHNIIFEQNHQYYDDFTTKYMHQNEKTFKINKKSKASSGSCHKCDCQNKKLINKNNSKSSLSTDPIYPVKNQHHYQPNPHSHLHYYNHGAHIQNNSQRLNTNPHSSSSSFSRNPSLSAVRPANTEGTTTTTTTTTTKNTLPNVEAWYHFDESCMAWLPVSSNLQKEFDTNYAQVKSNPNLKNVNPHFTFRIQDTWYGVRFDFSEKNERVPFGEQYKLNSKSVLRNVIKARPDASGCINGLPVRASAANV